MNSFYCLHQFRLTLNGCNKWSLTEKSWGNRNQDLKKKKKKIYLFFYTNCCYNFRLKNYIMVNSILKFCYSVWFTKKNWRKMYQSIKNVFLKSLIQTLLYNLSSCLVCISKEILFNTKEIISDEWLLWGNWIPYVPLLDTCWRQFVLMKIYPIYRLGSNHFYAL